MGGWGGEGGGGLVSKPSRGTSKRVGVSLSLLVGKRMPKVPSASMREKRILSLKKKLATFVGLILVDPSPTRGYDHDGISDCRPTLVLASVVGRSGDGLHEIIYEHDGTTHHIDLVWMFDCRHAMQHGKRKTEPDKQRAFIDEARRAASAKGGTA